MVQVTERAREMFKEALDQMVDAPSVALRLGPTGSGLGVFPDTPSDVDQVIEHDGQAVLVLDPEVSEALAGKTIDVEDHVEGSRFVLRA
jgi:Fe-S cluster assembly iron-binding protein IscA